MITTILIGAAIIRASYLMGRLHGATRERIELTGSSLPRPKDIPPTPSFINPDRGNSNITPDIL